MRAEVFTPAVVSSLFEACLTDRSGKPITDPLRMGARGGGFTMSAGVRTKVRLIEEPSIKVAINGEPNEARTTVNAIKIAINRLGLHVRGVEVSHVVEVPIGSGFGTSASGALGAVLALSLASRRPLSLVNAVRIAHEADVVSGTGLGSAEGLLAGGVGMVTEPGAPWFGSIDKIPLSDDLAVVAIHFGGIEKSTVLSSSEALAGVNEAGRRAMKRVKARPTIKSLLVEARRFAEESGIGDPELLRLADELVRAGAIGASQNMIGRAIHAVVKKARLSDVLGLARGFGGFLIVSTIYDGGPKVIEHS
ncbi:MAG: hypothetical protein AT710_04190 [Thermocladium sp. ECH_B]|nr:MAG: hypothetical protein AT710_04190 [Thermocladium sp. ECH_B]